MKSKVLQLLVAVILLLTACSSGQAPTATVAPPTALPTGTNTSTPTSIPTHTEKPVMNTPTVTFTSTPAISPTPSDDCKRAYEPLSLVVQVSAIVANSLTRRVTIYTSDPALWMIVGEGTNNQICYPTSLSPEGKEGIGKYYLEVDVPAGTSVLQFRRPGMPAIVYGGDYMDPGDEFDYVSVLLHPATPTPTNSLPASATPSKTPSPTPTNTVTPVVITP